MFDLQAIKKQRQTYLYLFVSQLFFLAALIYTKSQFEENSELATLLFLSRIVIMIIFIILLMKTVHAVLNYNIYVLIVLSLVILFIPYINFLTIALLDYRIYTIIKEEEKFQADKVKGEFCGLTVWSIPRCVLPYVGLIMVIIALRRIAASEGLLTGRTVGWISLSINLFSAYVYTWMFISLIAEFGFGVNIGGMPGFANRN